ncbi:MAG TPA: hypothetical protein PK184_19075, partial [Phycisphaerae bacterium]|nr:hypothetical protein [Phycisphaerae bacterium]
MKKVALAVMLLAASAFAAPDFTISSPTDFQVDEDGLVTLTFTQYSELGYTYGLSVFHVQPANSLEVVAYQVFQGLDSNLPSTTNPIGKMLDQLGDIGVNGYTVDNEPFMTITLKPLVLPIDIDWCGYYDQGDGTEGEIDWRTTTITPEPASMLLLAAGAAFFA